MNASLTIVKLRAAAKNAQIKGVSQLRKAELEQAVMRQHHGRKAVYEIRDAEFAAEAVKTASESGVFFLPKYVTKPHLRIEGTLSGFGELSRLAKANEQIDKDNNVAKYSYIGKVRAIRNHVIDNRLSRNLVWHEDETGFRLGRRH